MMYDFKMQNSVLYYAKSINLSLLIILFWLGKVASS